MRRFTCYSTAAAVTAAFLFLLGSGILRQPVAFAGATQGSLEVVDKEGKPVGQCPLKHTDVQVSITGFIARVTLTQEFANPLEEPIEAVYTFPMSEKAAVDSMVMTIGDRVVKGVIKEREEARRIYEAARDAGKAASLLDQERPNIFTQSVANILPGDDVRITISYVEYLKYEDGEYEFSFPMVVGPRYIPGAPTGTAGTDQVPDAGRITPPVTPEGTRAGHDIAVTVQLDAGVPLQDIRSELHEVEMQRDGEAKAAVQLKNQREIPNRDFVLKYKVAGAKIEDAVLTHHGEKGGFFTLILQPPARVKPEQITPKELIFVIDRSGSMSGFPIEKAKKCMRMCIEQMNANDTFNLVSFSGGLGFCFPETVPNTPENRRKALEYLANLEGRGGTEMMKAILAALEGQDDPERLRVVCFMTDGFIGNDMAILDAIQKNAGTARVFSFGIGNGVNRFLLEGMGRVGRGACEIVTLESDGDAAAQRFHERVHSPLLTDIRVDFGGLDAKDVYPDPAAMPDLFAARPLVLKGRYDTAGQGVVTLRGSTSTGPFERRIDVTLPDTEPAHEVLAPLWARARIASLMEQDWLGIQQGSPDRDTKGAITQLGLEFSLVTQFTSFVAVEEKVITEGGRPKTIEVPVEMTDGVSYEGVFGKGEAAQFGTAKAGRMAVPMMQRTPLAVEESAPVDRARTTFDRTGEPSSPPSASHSTVVPVWRDEDKETLEKLDPALRGLAAKVVNGSYTEGPVKVRNGWVRVFIHLADLSENTLKAVKAAGAKVTGEARSGKMVIAEVKVEDLQRLAKLDAVKKITPPTY